MRYRVLPYKQGSRSAKALAEALGGKVLRLQGSTYKPRQGDVLINWGNSDAPEEFSSLCLNYETAYVTNKLDFFLRMSDDIPDIIPEFWTNKEEIPNDAYPIVCRTILNGHSGSGIVVADSSDSVVVAPLYTKYIKKKDEYRVHVGRKQWVPHLDYSGEPMHEGQFRDPELEFAIIAVQRKARKSDHENPNWQVRNLAGGFVYTRTGFVAPDSVIEAACNSLRASGLDFGAVDVIWNEHEQKAYVLEINTAPGLEGQTVTDYAEYFKGLSNGQD